MLTFVLAAALAQDPGALIQKLLGADAVAASNAETDLLALGEPAREALRAAGAVETDPLRKRKLTSLADRLEARKAASALKAGDAWYAVTKDSLQIGWVHLKSEEKHGRIHFEDELQVRPSKDVSFAVKASQLCDKDEYLTSRELTLDVQSPDTTVTAAGRRKEDRLILEANGEMKALRVAKNTVTDLAVLRLVGLLPATEEYEVELLRLVKPSEPSAARFKKQLDEVLTLDGRAVKARQWLLLDGGDEDRTYWVDEAGRLLKARFGSVEMALTTEAKAKDVDVK
jgi:hypothetical protein